MSESHPKVLILRRPLRSVASMRMCFAIVAVAACYGCSSREPFVLVPASGSVSYEDGSPIPGKRVIVTFVPVAGAEPPDKKRRPLPGIAELSGGATSFDGATSHRYGDGIVKGKHKVLVVSLDEQDRPTAAVPPEYGDVGTTPLMIDATSGARNVDIRVARPKGKR